MNGTILAYGQTGAGKTYTMQGGAGNESGLIPRMVVELFHRVALLQESQWQLNVTIRASMVEVYLGKIRCLLDPSLQNLKLYEHPEEGVYIDGWCVGSERCRV